MKKEPILLWRLDCTKKSETSKITTSEAIGIPREMPTIMRPFFFLTSSLDGDPADVRLLNTTMVVAITSDSADFSQCSFTTISGSQYNLYMVALDKGDKYEAE